MIIIHMEGSSLSVEFFPLLGTYLCTCLKGEILLYFLGLVALVLTKELNILYEYVRVYFQ